MKTRNKLLSLVSAAAVIGFATTSVFAASNQTVSSVDNATNAPAYTETSNLAPVAAGTNTGAREAMAKSVNGVDVKSGLDIAVTFTNAAKLGGATMMPAKTLGKDAVHQPSYGTNYDKVGINDKALNSVAAATFKTAPMTASSTATTVAGVSTDTAIAGLTANPAAMVSLLD